MDKARYYRIEVYNVDGVYLHAYERDIWDEVVDLMSNTGQAYVDAGGSLSVESFHRAEGN